VETSGDTEKKGSSSAFYEPPVKEKKTGGDRGGVSRSRKEETKVWYVVTASDGEKILEGGGNPSRKIPRKGQSEESTAFALDHWEKGYRREFQ